MTHKKEVVFSLLFVIMVLCTGCSDKDNGDTSKNNRTSGESFVQEETIESTDNTDNADGSSAPTPELKTPRTKKELEDALGTVNESGKWTPPAGSHIDPKTGNILNKDGVVVGTTQEPYSKARPGSQGWWYAVFCRIAIDEPMNSLDEEGIILVRNIIKEMREKGTCILISSHYKEDIDIWCDVVYEVKKGMLKKIR